ncbi:NERD domain-containing protein [Halorientalis brevis]|uniref:NERD domain-containing protein n=1 Tax=Halorientalis brevis TaxID=1126241 RepID=A0ABD6CA94_9EURY|nr:nuclease-related domain-containing DEAD/DEAH box helicase [Halorientalis brevis]
MEFIASEFDDSNSGTDAERDVWDRLKRCFGPADVGVAYYRFPIIDEHNEDLDREADFLLLHKDYGLIVIECKGYRIEHLDRIEGATWILQNMGQDRAAPYSQARDQGFRVRSQMMRETELMDDQGQCSVVLTPIVALPNITRDEWEAHGFADLPSSPRVLCQDDLTPQSLRERLADVLGETELSVDEYLSARAVLSGGQAISGERGPILADAATKAAHYEQIEKGLQTLDEKQERIGLEIPDGPQQIRGIAGSGKTVLIARKAAAMHAKHPDWTIAVTFYTRSLYETIRSHVRRFYADFGGDDPDWGRLEVLHGWGGKREHGIYYKIAQQAGLTPKTYDEAKAAFGDRDDVFAACCEEVLEDGNIQQEFDAILIDEAQDMQPAFYQMCYAALTEPKRLIWAYDEAQNLTSLQAPSPKNVFGTDENGDPRVDLRGTYQGGIQKSRIMRKSYRTPREVLMVAHVLGMGLKSADGPVQAITTQKGWEDIGYEVLDGDFRTPGDPVRITRPPEYSPHPLQDEPEAAPFLGFMSFEGKEAELEYVAERIKGDIERQGLAPEEVMVIPFGGYDTGRSAGEFIADQLAADGIDANLVWNGDRSVFKEDGKVTISRIRRAKGNEAASVYLVNAERIARADWRDSRVQARNAAFVGVTRSRAWCEITGTGADLPLFDELSSLIESVNQPDPVVEFPAPNPHDLEKEIASDDSMATTLEQFE